MKITTNLLTIAATLLVSVLFVAEAGAQTKEVVVQTQSAPVQTSASIANNERPSAQMGIQQVQSLELSALRDRVTASLATVTGTLETTTLVDLDELVHKGVVHFTASANASGPVTEQHLLNVTVRYDARPIGGILTVKSDLVPVFSGIGTACRPTVSNQFSEAVDNLDDDTIADAIRHLTAQVQKQFATK
jgi:hypothetical protein